MKKIILLAFLILVCQSIDYFAIRFLKCQFNSGYFFGLFGANLAIISFGLVAIVTGFIYLKPNVPIPIVIAFAGAGSNLLDRLLYAGVVDYIHVPYWPIFNLADTLIVLSLVVFVCQVIRSNYKKSPVKSGDFL